MLKKNILYKCVAIYYKCLGALYTMLPHKQMSADDAYNFLKEKGYPFAYPFGEISPLTDSTIDLSIIIPVYNSEKFLSKCLDSILNQETKYQYEIICINDGSNDNSLEILNGYQECFPNKMVVISQNNRGISAARNRGLTLARGEFVGFIDNDDTVSPHYVERILNRQRETGADIVQTAYNNVNSAGTTLSTISHGDVIADINDIDWYLATAQGYIWGGALKKTIFEKLRFPIGFWYEDMITRLVAIRLAKRIATIGEPLYFYLIHDTNASKTLWRSNGLKSTDQYWLARQIVDYSINTLDLPLDNIAYHVLIEEYSLMFMHRMGNMDDKIRMAVFTLAAEYVNTLSHIGTINNSFLRLIEKNLKNVNYKVWQCACKSRYFEKK